MLSKYILNSNWYNLSGEYKFDKSVDLFNTDITVTGNLNLTYTAYLSNLNDYTNNNFSLLFLTKNSVVNRIFNNSIPKIDSNKQICILANRMQGDFVAEDTRFVGLSSTTLSLNGILTLSDSNFFEIDFLSSNELLLLTKKDRFNYFICVDDINVQITTIVKQENYQLNTSELNKIRFNYIYDISKKSIIIYRIIQNQVYILSVDGEVNIRLRKSGLTDLTVNDIFSLLKLRDLPQLKNNLSIVSYKKGIDKNNLNIESSVPVSNNFLAHIEYENIKNTSTYVNFLTLKNQINISDKSAVINLKENIREYNSIYSGGNREEGYENITLGYSSNYYPILLKSDKTTWFHVPHNNDNFRPNINDTLLVDSGAIAGKAPIFSDKIFKKAANYATTSNMGVTLDEEQTGTWLCSWLSGGANGSIWVDRFFNKTSFTPYEALIYSSNVTYTPKYDGKKGEGITDTPSNMTLEPGAWYAYSRIGYKTSNKILSGLSNKLLSLGLNSFKNQNRLDVNRKQDSEGEDIYEFNGNSFGTISTEKNTNFNNLTISFFATRDKWETSTDYQIFGNYIDSGIGFFNNNYVNPVNYYINGKKLHLLNNIGQTILSINTEDFLNEQDFAISNVFIREFNSNFHIVTDNNYILEFNSNGTLVDLLKIDLAGSKKIISSSNNPSFGVLFYEDYTCLRVELFSNIIEDYTNRVIFTENVIGSTPNILIDAFNYIYCVNGTTPILKGSNLYYRSIEENSIKFFNTNTSTISTYITNNNEKIMGYNFDKKQNTHILLKDSIEFYNTQGVYISSIPLHTNNIPVTAYNISFFNLNGNEQGSVMFANNNLQIGVYNLNNSQLKIVDSSENESLNTLDKLYRYNLDFTNYNYMQTNISSLYPLPSYNFKIKLFNQFNYEDVVILNVVLLGSNLDTGTHHFALVLDVVKGSFKVYVDGTLYASRTFEPLKYSFSNLFPNSIVIGSVPFYGGLLYGDFYKSDDLTPFMSDMVIEKLKIYNIPLNEDEIKLLYFQKYKPKDIVVDIKMGTRNYLDTITRTFKHKMQGSKSNLIDLTINDSLINDSIVQKRYEMLILKQIQSVLPGYVKINSIKWRDNKDNNEKMLEGNFNVRNTLTNNIE